MAVRYALGVEYAGSCYSGWQQQKQGVSVQQSLQQAISFVANHPVLLVCAGRTDAGVHAVEQVAHFESDSIRDKRAWLLGANSRLPDDIRVKWVEAVDERFHARFSAIARSYRYIIFNSRFHSALFHQRSGWDYRALDHQLMHDCAQVLVGEHDFSAFRAAGCQSKSSRRQVHFINVNRQGDWIYLDIKANAFLYHMVRNIAGCLMSIGSGERSRAWFIELFAAKDRNCGYKTAAAAGLYFLCAHYPECYQLPSMAEKPALFCSP